MNAERRYGLIVFDWDGTLIDSAASIVASIQEAARDLALPVPEHARARYVIGLGLQDSLRHAVPELTAERYAEFVERYRVHFLAREEKMQVFEGIPELLERLAGRGRQLAIATGKSRRGLMRALESSGLGRHFHASRCADETQPKPHPAMLRELMQEFGSEPERVLMIGDTSHDLAMASAAGVDAVAVAYGAHSLEELRALQPRHCAISVTQLNEWLEANA